MSKINMKGTQSGHVCWKWDQMDLSLQAACLPCGISLREPALQDSTGCTYLTGVTGTFSCGLLNSQSAIRNQAPDS